MFTRNTDNIVAHFVSSGLYNKMSNIVVHFVSSVEASLSEVNRNIENQIPSIDHCFDNKVWPLISLNSYQKIDQRSWESLLLYALVDSVK